MSPWSLVRSRTGSSPSRRHGRSAAPCQSARHVQRSGSARATLGRSLTALGLDRCAGRGQPLRRSCVDAPAPNAGHHGGLSDSDLQYVPALARDFTVSKKAVARAYVQYHPGRIAIVVTGNGRVQRYFRSLSFPDIISAVGSPIPVHSLDHSSPHRPNVTSDFAACSADLWIDVKRDLHRPSL